MMMNPLSAETQKNTVYAIAIKPFLSIEDYALMLCRDMLECVGRGGGGIRHILSCLI